MFEKVIRYLTLLLIWGVQLCILAVGFYAFTSTIKAFPWFEPLTMGAFLVVIYSIPFQFVEVIVESAVVNKMKLPKILTLIPALNLISIFLAVIITIANEQYFYKLAYLYGTIELIFVAIWVSIPIGLLIKKAGRA